MRRKKSGKSSSRMAYRISSRVWMTSYLVSLNTVVSVTNLLEENYVELYTTPRAASSLEKIFANHGDIANTWVTGWGTPSLLNVIRGTWTIASGAEDEARKFVEEYSSKALVAKPNDEEYFQRKYGLRPGKFKDTRRLEGPVAFLRRRLRRRTFFWSPKNTWLSVLSIVWIPSSLLILRRRRAFLRWKPNVFSPLSIRTALSIPSFLEYVQMAFGITR